MSNDIKLNSAAAVEVAAFCWPAGSREWKDQGGFAGLEAVDVECGLVLSDHFDITDFNDLHRAAAVLVGRGFAERMNRNLIGEWDRTRHTGPHTNDFMAWLLTAPAEAWARAILATVREVSK